MKRFVVVTTVNEKSDGLHKFEAMPGWQTVVVGDAKTPPLESSGSLTFLSLEDQQELGFAFARLCPVNHYTRKNVGYLYAMSRGADLIYDTDDDNIPYDDWEFPEFSARSCYATAGAYANVYSHFSDAFVWPRGFPLDEVRGSAVGTLTRTDPVDVGVWQGLADYDPDVDAIHRLLFSEPITFARRDPIYLPAGCFSPFNSQNTLWQHRAFAGLYLPATTSFRFTDILRGYVAQALMWADGLHLGVTRATVFQDRNAHDLIRDFSEEIVAYTELKAIVDAIVAVDLGDDPNENLLLTYTRLAELGFVSAAELDLCRAWLHDVASLRTGRVAVHG